MLILALPVSGCGSNEWDDGANTPMPKGLIEVIAPAGGLVTSVPDQALQPNQWSTAEGVEFKTGIAARRSGIVDYKPNTGYPTTVDPVIIKTLNFTGAIADDDTTTINADAGSGPLNGTNALLEDHILIISISGVWGISQANAPSITYNTQLDGSGTDITRVATFREGSTGPSFFYITRPPRYITSFTFSPLAGGGIVDDHSVSLNWVKNINTDDPIVDSTTTAPTTDVLAQITGLTFSVDRALLIASVFVVATPTRAVGASLTQGAGQTSLAYGIGPLTYDSDEFYDYVDYKGPLDAADGASPGQSFTWTPSAGNVTYIASAIILRPSNAAGSIIGNTSTEEVLNLFDYVVDDTTRHLVAITNEHVWRYSPDDDVFIPIDATDGVVNYTTGTVSLTDYNVIGAGGADFTATPIAEDDIIHLTAGADQRYRRVHTVSSGTALITEPSWLTKAGSTGLAYAIKRPLQQYTAGNKPWAIGYLGTLYVGSLDTVMTQWDGTALTMSASVAASGTLPKSAAAIIYANHLIMGYTNVGASDEPRTIRWASIGEPLEWNKPIASGGDSGSMGIDESQAPLVGFARLDEYCVIFMGDSIHLLSYVGGAFTFLRRQISRDIGALARDGITQLRDRVLFVGTDNFYSLSSAGLEVIGSEVFNEFYNNLDYDKAYLINAVADIERSEWIINYKTASSTGNYPDRRLIYNYRNNTWSADTANGTTASARVQVKNSTSGQLLSSITTPANEYPRPYDDVADLQTSTVVLFGAGDSNGESDKIQQIAKTAQYTSRLERAGLRLQTGQGKATENVQYLRRLYLGFNSKSTGNVRVAVGSRFNENEDYTIDTQQVYTIGTNRGYLPILSRGKEFLLRIETDAATGDGDYELERYRLEGEIGGER